MNKMIWSKLLEILDFNLKAYEAIIFLRLITCLQWSLTRFIAFDSFKKYFNSKNQLEIFFFRMKIPKLLNIIA